MQTRGALLEAAGSEPDIGRVLGANFAAGMLAGGIAAAATCPLDVVKTWRQIEVCFIGCRLQLVLQGSQRIICDIEHLTLPFTCWYKDLAKSQCSFVYIFRQLSQVYYVV